jgi:hypothetical protein
MNPSNGLTHQSIVVRPATLMDLGDVLSIRQAQELAEDGIIFTTAERLAGEWESRGHRLAEHVWVVVAADNRLVACAELARVDRVLVLRFWSAPEYRDAKVNLTLLAKSEQQACTIGREDSSDCVTIFSQATSSQPEAREALTQSDFALLSTYEKMELALNESPTPPENISGTRFDPSSQTRTQNQSIAPMRRRS